MGAMVKTCWFKSEGSFLVTVLIAFSTGNTTAPVLLVPAIALVVVVLVVPVLRVVLE